MNKGKVALMYGPLVLAADEALLGTERSGGRLPLNGIAVASPELSKLKFTPEPAPEGFNTWPGAKVFRVRGVTRKPIAGVKLGTPVQIGLVPFADAGGSGTHYKVWLPLPLDHYRGNVLLDARESRSRQGSLPGSITDEDFETAVTTFDGKLAEEDWFAAELDQPAVVKRVLFAHGKTLPEGGWFDASAGKPRIQVKRTKDGPWETVVEIAEYPPTTSKDSAEMDGGESVTCTLPSAVQAWAIRVIGKPACGKNPQQACASCAELQAFSE
jgi:hypothetical protein